MIVYYHTPSYIYAISNGFCSAVYQPDCEADESNPMVGRKLAGGVCFPEVDVLVPIEQIQPGCCLCFILGASSIITQPIFSLEETPSLSLPPRPRSLLPSAPAEILHIPSLPPPLTMRSLAPESKK